MLIPADVLDALLAVRRADPTARLGPLAAAALHLGRPLTAPTPVSTHRPQREVPPSLVRVTAASHPTRGDLRVEGVRLTDLEHTVAALTLSDDADAVDRIADLVLRGSALEARAVDPQRLHRAASQIADRAASARVAWWCFRLGAAAPPSRATVLRGDVVALSPSGPLDGPRAARFGLALNVADGLPDPGGAAGAVFAEALGPRRHVPELATLFTAGLALAPSFVPDEMRRTLTRFEALRFVCAEGTLLRPRAPCDGALTTLAAGVSRATTRRLLRDVLRRIDPGAGPDAAVAASLAHLSLGDAEGAHTAFSTRASWSLADAAPTALSRLLAALPLALRGALARVAPSVFERLGRWDDLARFVREDLRSARGPAKGRLLVAAARVAWRRDRVREAEAHIARLSVLREVAPGDRFEAALLRATLDAEAGAFEPASALLREALSRARADEDQGAEARALHRLGTIDARKGRLREALASYNAALARCPPDARALRGVLLSNSAAIQLWTGRLEAAEALARAAWHERSGVASPSEQVATRVLSSRIDAARGRPAPPGGRMLPLAWEAEQSGSLRLAAEVWLDAAGELATSGRHDAAHDAIDRARRMLVQIEGAEPALTGLVDEADGARRFARGDADGALTSLTRAVTALDGLGAVFYATRARLELAAVKLHLGDARGALRAMARVATACEAGELAIGASARHVAVYALAAVSGGEATRRHAERALATLDIADLEREIERRAGPSLAQRFASRQEGARAVATTVSSGRTRSVDAPSLARLRDGTAGAVVVDLREATLSAPGRAKVSLLRRRILSALLAALARAGREGLSVDSLAARVWQRRATASTRTAVKVAVSRLRALLGAHAPALQAARVEGVAGYRWEHAHTPLVLIVAGDGDR